MACDIACTMLVALSIAQSWSLAGHLSFLQLYKFKAFSLPTPSLHPQTKHLITREFSVPTFKQKESAMISAKRIAQLAKKWQRMAALGRKRLAMKSSKEAEECSTSVAGNGHCIMYTADGRRFEVTLVYLGTRVFTELLTMSQEEFGFSSYDGRITLPCDATVMEYVLCLLRRNVSAEVEIALLSSITMPMRCTGSVAPSLGTVSNQFGVCSF